jgi:hypothetical protein
MNRWKILPHRVPAGRRAGQCRDCGQYDITAAPDACTRCALERYQEAGFFTIRDPVAAFEIENRERWRQVAQQLRTGRVRADLFYLFVGLDDGGPLEPPPDELLPRERAFAHASRAHEAGMVLTARYPQVWVVTTVGCWSVASGR